MCRREISLQKMTENLERGKGMKRFGGGRALFDDAVCRCMVLLLSTVAFYAILFLSMNKEVHTVEHISNLC